MKFEAGKYRYPLKADNLEGAVWWANDPETHPGEPCFAMALMSSEDIVRKHADEDRKGVKLRAKPFYAALLCNELWLWPTPDQDVLAKVRYSTMHEM